jgi:hypothetical protein
MGLEVVWPETPYVHNWKIAPGIHLVEPTDRTLTTGLPGLVQTLARLGIHQFAADPELADEIADSLSQEAISLGLVLTLEEWTEDRKLANLPTALIVLPEEKYWWQVERFVEWAKDASFTSIIVARRDSQYRGRRFDQWVSQHAPISQQFLTTLTKG